MDKKVYEKTRYQNIYRHKKNKNYLVMISKPVKTSIAEIDGEKIFKLDIAIKVRDNPKIRLQKGVEALNRETFDTLWVKYIDWCKNIDKQAYNTYHKKEKYYNKYFKGKFKKVSKIRKEDMAYFINNQKCSDKTKNEIIKIIKPFFNWCVEKNIIIINPITGIKLFKTPKPKMKFLTPEQITKLLDTINNDINNDINKEIAYRTKMFTIINFSLGDRVGETRVLQFNSFNEETLTVNISKSISYDTKTSSYFSATKTKQSDRDVTISQKLIDEIKKYKYALINEFDYDILDDEIIFSNHITKKPISDTTLRKNFYTYLDKANIPRVRMYDLRHTFVATMMAEGKQLYHISERIGHSDYNTTVNKYGHLSNKTKKEVAESTDKYF